MKDSSYKKLIASMTYEEYRDFLDKRNAYMKERRAKETPEQREKRLEKARARRRAAGIQERQPVVHVPETPEQKRIRMDKRNEYNRKRYRDPNRYEQLKEYYREYKRKYRERIKS